MQKLFQKLIMMHAYFVRKASCLNILETLRIKFSTYTLRPIIYHELLLQLNTIAKALDACIKHQDVLSILSLKMTALS